MDNPPSQTTFGEQADPAPVGGLGRGEMLSVGLLIASLWLTTRPYTGVRGDSELYTVQALNSLLSGRFDNDLFFHYGSQDQFTVFSLIYKPFLIGFGISRGNLMLTVLGECLFVACLFYLARSIFDDGKMAFVAVTGAIVLPVNLFGEAILTPRLFAEAFTLYAMGSMLRGRPVSSFVVLCLSTTIHPLMTLPGLVVFFIYEANKRPVLWLAASLAIIAGLTLATCGVQPFARLFVCVDAKWLAVIQVCDRSSFLTKWPILAWSPIFTTFALAALGAGIGQPRERRFLVTVLAVALGGLIMSFIGGDELHNLLIVDIQTWRSAWLLGAVAHLMIGPLYLRLASHCKSSFANGAVLLVFALGLFTLSGFMPGLSVISAPVAIIACLVTAREHRNRRALSMGTRFLVYFCIAISCEVAIILIYILLGRYTTAPDILLLTSRDIVLMVVALGALGFYLSKPANVDKLVTWRVPMLCLSIVLVAIAGFNWDQRSAWTKYVDSTVTAPSALAALLPEDSTVYWEGDVTLPWFVLKRPSYFSCEQGAGALFSHGTAIEYQRRYENFQPLRTLDFGGRFGWCPPEKGLAAAPLRRSDLSTVCQKDPGLGALVLIKPAEDDPGEVWVSPVDFDYERWGDGKLKVLKTDRFYIYSCANP
jgi:hypothetical protein